MCQALFLAQESIAVKKIDSALGKLSFCKMSFPNPKIQNTLQSKTFKHQHDAIVGNFMPDLVTGHNQNTSTLKLLYKITFRLWVESIYQA